MKKRKIFGRTLLGIGVAIVIAQPAAWYTGLNSNPDPNFWILGVGLLAALVGTVLGW